MTPSSLCILNCVGDAKLFLSKFRGHLNEWRLVSTHGSVDDYLETMGIRCTALSSLITDHHLREFYNTADKAVPAFLTRLDNVYAGPISEILRLSKIRYFYPLYVYLGKYEYLNILKLRHALDVLFRENHYEEVLLYQSVPTSYFDRLDIQAEVVRNFIAQIAVRLRIVTNRGSGTVAKKFATAKLRLSRAVLNPRKTAQKIVSARLQFMPRKNGSQENGILLIQPSPDLSALRDELRHYRVVLWPEENGLVKSKMKENLDEEAVSQMISRIKEIVCTKPERFEFPQSDTFMKAIFSDFWSNIEQYAVALLDIDGIVAHENIRLAMWGIPPISGYRSLVVEYLLQKKIPLIGMQHGGSYVVQKCGNVHFDSDFDRCSHYLSYGFDEADIHDSYPDKINKCKIIPAGSVTGQGISERTAHTPKKKRIIDILFPITNSLSFFLEAYRINANQLHIYQRELIMFLDELSTVRVYIKPFVGYTDETCSTIELFKKLQKAKLLKNITLTECLDKYDVRAVVMDYPSTPLFEVVGKDIEVFLLRDPVLPFTPVALELLRKRVHYFEHIEDLKNALLQYVQSKLPSLRNDEFYDRYVCRRNARESILGTIETLMNEKYDASNYGACKNIGTGGHL
jgi:hypothetical protein